MKLRALRQAAIKLIFVSGILALASVQPASAFETQAKQVFLADFETGTELYSKNADELMPPASMTKMMTIYMLFERLKEGRLSLDDEFTVSEKAWRKGGSKMFVEAGKRVRVEDLIRGIVVQSGNDASIVVAEGLSGNEEAFAREMTAKARQLGMPNSTFTNASGWPSPEHQTTARDLATLAEATIRDFPDLYHYYSETSFEYSGITQGNRNPLLGGKLGVDGLKTGHTEKAGYGLTASAKRKDRRLILVVNGLPSEQARRTESQRLLDWGFREFENYMLFQAGDKMSSIEIWLGDKGSIPLVTDQSLTLTLARRLRKSLKVTAHYEQPIPAPIAKGSRLGNLVVEVAEHQPIEVPLLAGENVEQLGVTGRLSAAFKYLLWGASD